MTQVSRRYIKKQTLEKILDIFISSFIKIKNKQTAQGFFDEFLTPTEKIMLAKRIVCFYLLFKNISIRDSANILKLSTSTVAKYSIFIKDSVYIKNVLNKILVEENFKRLLDTFIFEFIRPPLRYGTDWRAGRISQEDYEERKQSPL